MARALALAAEGVGLVSPNPSVGAVLVRAGHVVGEGRTQPPGGPHAEIVALRQAGEAARGATLYVTLEPCAHRGRTGPCTAAIIAAGVAEVHLALRDPSPWVAGRGVAALRAAGIAVVEGERAEEARRLNAAYFSWVERGRPLVTAKYAMTADGKIATRTGDSRWVSGAAARERVMELRRRSDAVIVGVGTVLADDPQLTARPGGVLAERQPLRVVLDSRARTPPGARLLGRDLPGRALIITTDLAPAAARAALEAAGAEVAVVPARDGRVDPAAALRLLGERQVTAALVESGGELLAALLAAGLVDRVVAFVAPKLVGGAGAPTPVGGLGLARMADAWRLSHVAWEVVGDDLMLSGDLDPYF